MTLPAELNFSAYRGDTFIRTLNLTDSLGDPLDVTGWSWSSQIRRKKNDTAAAATITVEVLNAAQGQLKITLPAATSASLEKLYYWDLQSDQGSDVIKTLLSGTFEVTADVTRS